MNFRDNIYDTQIYSEKKIFLSRIGAYAKIGPERKERMERIG